MITTLEAAIEKLVPLTPISIGLYGTDDLYASSGFRRSLPEKPPARTFSVTGPIPWDSGSQLKESKSDSEGAPPIRQQGGCLACGTSLRN
jgi:hypothetical protein